MSEFQRGYNAGLMAILKEVASAANITHFHDTADLVAPIVTSTTGPPLTTFEHGKRKAIQDYLEVMGKDPHR